MDPVTHTLVGGALATTGLSRRSRLGTATLLVGANLPDIDVVAYLWSAETALWFRRGVTHGVAALVFLPVLLTGVMLLWDRHGPSPSGPPQARGTQLLMLSYLAVATHPLLDALNVYGMRWLMPFSDHWFYADTLFIVDPWVLILLGVVMLARRGRSPWRLRIGALALLGVYVVGMAGSGAWARELVRRTAVSQGVVPERVMAAPVPVNPFVRAVVVEDANGYLAGRLRWLPRPQLRLERLSLSRFPPSPAAAAAVRGPTPRSFLSWARFPFFVVVEHTDMFEIQIGDARYTFDPSRSWAATSVRIDR